ncbi:MAG: CDGSH iron-sulfur domain-containing protein [Deltaproteobacteria bacterium]|nr:CDGSH iron-sulfur domain-containing protein [Deltaproteobacteria bacterium]
MSKINKYEGRKITVFFDSDRCIHSRNCVLGLPSVFRANIKGEWVDPNGASAEEIASIVRTCPSGALTYCRSDSGYEEMAPQVNLIKTLENGPLSVHATIFFEGKSTGNRAVLCRCGASKNKPYCDGSHKEISFIATGEPRTGKIDPLEKRDGPLAITPLKDGPLIAEGNLELCSGTGRPLLRTQKTFLCRCGASANKPFCDGSHKKAGFKSD